MAYVEQHWHLHNETGQCYGDVAEFEEACIHAAQHVWPWVLNDPSLAPADGWLTVIEAPFCLEPCREDSDMTDIERRYPRLLRAMQWVAILSEGEAIGAIRDYQAGFTYSSEAVNHFGGPRRVIERAYTVRHLLADMRRSGRDRPVNASDRTPLPGYCPCGQPVVPGQPWCQEYQDILNEPDSWREVEERDQAEWQRQQAGEE